MTTQAALPVSISDDLALTVGNSSAVILTPAQGLDLAEDIARKAFRRALAEEAVADAGADLAGAKPS